MKCWLGFGDTPYCQDQSDAATPRIVIWEKVVEIILEFRILRPRPVPNLTQNADLADYNDFSGYL